MGFGGALCQLGFFTFPIKIRGSTEESGQPPYPAFHLPAVPWLLQEIPVPLHRAFPTRGQATSTTTRENRRKVETQDSPSPFHKWVKICSGSQLVEDFLRVLASNSKRKIYLGRTAITFFVEGMRPTWATSARGTSVLPNVAGLLLNSGLPIHPRDWGTLHLHCKRLLRCAPHNGNHFAQTLLRTPQLQREI
ncbi:hypothetical protein GWK47_017976 [Chionoecetes opilio]|uniref:Uncharacterized protein n=1 Tax=Chionoecetes opilio TaxID=41210 RepID=A0A8J4XS79_CHIOP|nr:hypothetical protein GWK47_017976 [Chionoecetes opilio]